MEIHKGETLSGYAITITDDGCYLTLYETDATFSDGAGEIIVEGLPEYSLSAITEAEAFQLFSFAKAYFDNLKAYMKNMEDE
jgi:hypothetical protein